MTEQTQVIGVDFGGTAIKMGRFTRDGECLASLSLPTPQPATPEAVIPALVEGINQLNSEQTCRAIGVGTPGPVDETAKISLVAINLSNWWNVPLAKELEKAIGLPTFLANDANCAGLGEAWLGAGRGYKNLILLTLGTGIGGAIIINGELFTGHRGAAGELGLITLRPDGPSCNSGNQGSLEQYISIQAIRRRTGKEPKELADLAELGDKFALDFWQEYGRDLGIGLTTLIYVLTPEVIILGGGISGAINYFLPSVLAEIEHRILFMSREDLKIIPAQLGNQAGAVGAARLAWQFLNLNT